ncbi:hypothetical protein BD414DRAFT_562178 [Trametes punicea]|nr:hypothetical protein BD414DRAFT_562178 [Trametes punicea]
MSTRRIVTRRIPSRTRCGSSATSMVDYLAMSLQERFAIFETFSQEIARDGSYLHPAPKIKPPPHAHAARRCVKRVPVPVPPTVLECPEEEDDFLEEAESTTACDETSPVCAYFCDKPLPLAPCQEKALPPTPKNQNKALPPLPPQAPGLRGRAVQTGTAQSPSPESVMTAPKSLPDDFVLDVHDLAAIAHARTEPRFPHAQLHEINRGDTPLTAFSDQFLDAAWHDIAFDKLYSSRGAHKYRHFPDGVKTPGGHELTRRELEDVYWRCKDFDSGYVLAYVAQRVFDGLPPTAMLRARTSTKHEVLCKPSQVAVAEIDIRPKEACLIVTIKPRSDLGPSMVEGQQHISGFTEGTLGCSCLSARPSLWIWRPTRASRWT